MTLPLVIAIGFYARNNPLKVWKTDTSHQTALWASLAQCMGTVGTVRVVPALGPALSVHVQVGGGEP